MATCTCKGHTAGTRSPLGFSLPPCHPPSLSAFLGVLRDLGGDRLLCAKARRWISNLCFASWSSLSPCSWNRLWRPIWIQQAQVQVTYVFFMFTFGVPAEPFACTCRAMSAVWEISGLVRNDNVRNVHKECPDACSLGAVPLLAVVARQ